MATEYGEEKESGKGEAKLFYLKESPVILEIFVNLGKEASCREGDWCMIYPSKNKLIEANDFA